LQKYKEFISFCCCLEIHQKNAHNWKKYEYMQD